MEIKIEDMIGGQPKREPKKTSEVASRYYHLGRRSAFLDKQKEENNQNFQLNNTQQVMINQATMKLMEVLQEVSTRQKMLDMQMQQTMGPPQLPGVGPPPLPIGQQLNPQQDMLAPPPENQGIAPHPQDMQAEQGPPPENQDIGGIPLDQVGAAPPPDYGAPLGPGEVQ